MIHLNQTAEKIYFNKTETVAVIKLNIHIENFKINFENLDHNHQIIFKTTISLICCSFYRLEYIGQTTMKS